MIVMKFGGTSVKDASAIKNVIEIVSSKNQKVLVVVSAMSKITDKLLKIVELANKSDESYTNVIDEIESIHIIAIQELGLNHMSIEYIKNDLLKLKSLVSSHLGNINTQITDSIISRGEALSSFLVNQTFLQNNQSSAHIDSRKYLKTDSNFGQANVDFVASQENFLKLEEKFNQHTIFVMGGFIASDSNDNTTTLGRGGSDYSAAIFASLINAEALEIWTDVDGILTSDPRLVNNTLQIKHLSYLEASELAYFGAKVLHPKTIFPAIDKKIPVWVKNSFNPSNSGTLIFDNPNNLKRIKAIAFRKGVTIINIISNRMLGAVGFISKVFEVFRDFETSVDLVTTSEVSISVTIEDTSNLSLIEEKLSEFAVISTKKGNCIISAVGEGIRETSGIAARFFGVLKDINISMVSVGASEVNLSIIVKEDEFEQAVKLLHTEFFANVNEPEIFA